MHVPNKCTICASNVMHGGHVPFMKDSAEDGTLLQYHKMGQFLTTEAECYHRGVL